MSDINTWPGWTSIRQLGSGSFGKVYEIRREEFGKTYTAALKVITIPQNQADVQEAYGEGMDEQSITEYFHSFVENITGEFALMSELKGQSNIVSYEDHMVIEHEGSIGWDIIIRMELLTPLQQWNALHPLTETDVIKLGCDICRALELCQKKNIIHRDIKPENIFVSAYGDYKLGDFGIARIVERTVSSLSKKGTYTYMAPEVYLGHPYGLTADIYSLGTVLYRYLNDNRAPFIPLGVIRYEDRDKALVKRMKGEQIPPPVNGSLKLKDAILKSLAFTPGERFQTATEFRRALESCMQNVEEQSVTEILPMSVDNSYEMKDYQKDFFNVQKEENVGKELVDGEFGSRREYDQAVSRGLVKSFNKHIVRNHNKKTTKKYKNVWSTLGITSAIIIGLIFIVMYLFGKNDFGKDSEVLAYENLEVNSHSIESNTILEKDQEEKERRNKEEAEKRRKEEIIDSCIDEMPLEDKVAELFIVAPEALSDTEVVVRAGDTTKEQLNMYAVGGLIYFSQNIRDSDQITELLSNTKDFSKYPIFLAIDEEGGMISRVAESGLAPNVGSMSEIGNSGDIRKAQEAGTTIGTYLSDLGFNLNFAPVADVVTKENTTIGSRSFGTDTNLVASMVAAMVESVQNTGVSACLKHFPGLGDTTETFDGMVTSDKTLEDFVVIDFPVYQAGIEAGVDFVMVSHLSAPYVTGDNTPASLSEKMITEILRGQLGYQGVVITDAMTMRAITVYYTPDEAAVKALQAGVDMILMPEDFEVAYNGVLKAVDNGVLTEERIDESLRRIFRIKYKDR